MYLDTCSSLASQKLTISCGTGNMFTMLLICLISVSWEAWNKGSSVHSTVWFPVVGMSSSLLYFCRVRWVPIVIHSSKTFKLNSWNIKKRWVSKCISRKLKKSLSFLRFLTILWRNSGLGVDSQTPDLETVSLHPTSYEILLQLTKSTFGPSTGFSTGSSHWAW
jgi:hypothetical protein